MELKKGYKQTEVGVIPKDWETFSISELFEFQGGSQPPRDTFVFNDRNGYVRLLQIRDYKTDKYASYIPISLAKRSCTSEDIMIGRYGPPIFQILKGLEGAYNVALIKAVPTEIITKKYGWFILNQNKLFEFVEKLSQRSSGQTGVDLHELKKYLIPLPTKAEQTAIATALSDMDDLINSLSTLIEKKKAIKQGAMQQLLKPKEGWVVKPIKEIVSTPVTDGPHETPVFIQTGIPFLSVNNLVDNKIDFTDLRYISEEDHIWFSKKCKPKKNDILLGKAASVGKVAILEIEDEINIWSPIALIRPKEEYFFRYIYYFLQTDNIIKQIEFFTNSSSQGNIGMGDIEKFEISFPERKQQVDFANTLSSMDNEISALEQNHSKYQMLKQGMMQELLTGKTRLV